MPIGVADATFIPEVALAAGAASTVPTAGAAGIRASGQPGDVERRHFMARRVCKARAQKQRARPEGKLQAK